LVSVAGIVLVTLSGFGCGSNRGSAPQAQPMAGKTIEQVQTEHTDQWMTLPGVVGTAIGQRAGKPCILVLTSSNTEQVRRQIPPIVEGYPVVVQEIGPVRALDR
jgi:hypothetical protein